MICKQKEPFSYQKENSKNGYKFSSHLHQRNLIRLRIRLSENVVLRVPDKPTSLDPQPHSPSSIAATFPLPGGLRWRGPTRSGHSSSGHTDRLQRRGTSPSLPEDYVRALGRQHPLNARASEPERIYLAIADYGLHSAVKTVAACARAGIEHIRASVGRQVATAFIDTAMEPLTVLDAVRRSIPDVELNPLAWAPS